MRPVEQTKTDGVGGGNCVAACIASLFEVPLANVDVPCGGSYQAVCTWTRREFPGLYPISVQREREDWEPLDAIAWPAPFKSYWIASVESPRTAGLHCIVMHGSEVVWDPHPRRDQGFGRCGGWLYWIVRDPSLLVPRGAAGDRT